MARPKTLQEKPCVQCGESFKPAASVRKYCSTECRAAARRRPMRNCPQCKEDYQPKTPKQKFCSHKCSSASQERDRLVVCAICKVEFERPHGKPRVYCSRSCSMVARNRGMKASYAELQPRKRYADGWFRTQDGYKAKRVDGKQILEHRQVMEEMIGRPLMRGERVHHMNGKRDDNRPENLELWTGVGTSKKDPHGVRLRDKVLDMLDSLKQDELQMVIEKAQSLIKAQE